LAVCQTFLLFGGDGFRRTFTRKPFHKFERIAVKPFFDQIDCWGACAFIDRQLFAANRSGIFSLVAGRNLWLLKPGFAKQRFERFIGGLGVLQDPCNIGLEVWFRPWSLDNDWNHKSDTGSCVTIDDFGVDLEIDFTFGKIDEPLAR